MKIPNFITLAFIAVLMVLVVSCTPMQQSRGGGYEEAPGSGRVYRTAPYGGNQVIVVERDPYTGQYYQVSPYGYYGGSPYYNPFGYGYPGDGYYRGGNSGNNRPAPRQQQPRTTSPTTNRAKEIIRGN